MVVLVPMDSDVCLVRKPGGTSDDEKKDFLIASIHGDAVSHELSSSEDTHKVWAFTGTWELNHKECNAYCNLTSAFERYITHDRS